MERIVKVFANFSEAEEDEIQKEISMTPEERLEAAKELRDRYYGIETSGIRKNNESFLLFRRYNRIYSASCGI